MQADDLIVDVVVTRWGFRKALTVEERLKSDHMF